MIIRSFKSLEVLKVLKQFRHVSNYYMDFIFSRLSKFAGANLRDNNPNIADLSDARRPTKLAEEYSELYDNQWTEAYSKLEKSLSAEKIVGTLFHIVEVSAKLTCF